MCVGLKIDRRLNEPKDRSSRFPLVGTLSEVDHEQLCRGLGV